MSLTKVTSSVIADNAITTAKIENGTIVNADINSSANISQSKLSLAVPTVTGVTIQNGVGAIIPSDTSLYFDVAGTNFTNPSTVELINNSTNAATQATTVTYVSSTALRVTASLAAGTYKIRVTRSDGFSAISASALLTSSQVVAFSTSAGSLGTVDQNVAISTITIAATSDSAITFAVQSGSLPGGLSLNTSNGQITGTPNAVSADTTSTFTIRATDAESQFADREFTITVTKVVITKSLRFNDGDSPELSKTLGSPTNNKIYTFSMWLKRGVINSVNPTFIGHYDGSGSNPFVVVQFKSDGTLRIEAYDNDTTSVMALVTNQVFRDPSSWYHVVLAFDTTQGTSSNRVKAYVNGNQITSFSTETYPSQNKVLAFNKQSTEAYYGIYKYGGANCYDGYMAEIHFIDGTAKAPTDFGETDSTTNNWIPKRYTGSYGNNGHYLDFADSSNLGDDESGNTNDFTVTNLAAIDQTTDTPQNNFATMNPLGTNDGSTHSEGNTKLVTPDSAGISGANIAMTSGKWYAEFICTAKSSVNMNVGIVRADTFDGDNQMDEGNNVGYMYQNNGNIFHGSADESYGASWAVDDIIGIAFDADTLNVQFYKNGTGQGNYTRIASENSGGDWIMCVGEGQGGATATFVCNFGNPSFAISSSNADANGHGNFEYAVPSGYLALCTDNLPEASIKDSSAHFNTVLWTGNGGTNAITGVGFKPDWVWGKDRTGTDNHHLFDTTRGTNQRLISNSTAAENTESNCLDSFDSDGFTLGSNTGLNNNGDTHVAWNWKAGGSAPTNTYTVKVVSDGGNKYRFDDYGTSAITLELQEGGTFTFDQSDSSNSGHPLRFYTASDKSGGEYTTGVTTTGTPGSAGAKTVITVAASAPTLYYQCSSHAGMGGQANTRSLHGFTNIKGSIQSVVSPNTTAGFSIVTYSGNATQGATVGHGLGKAPAMIFVKGRDQVTNWNSWHKSFSDNQFITLDRTNAVSSDANTFPDASDMTSSTFEIGSASWVNGNNNTFVAYCFAEIEGYSKMETYTGNGNADGPFVYTGFKPAWVMIKGTSSSREWFLFDNKRDTFNVVNKYVKAESTDAEASSTFGDFCSNGFKVRSDGASYNTNGQTFIYMAFAESPFGGILTNEATAR